MNVARRSQTRNIRWWEGTFHRTLRNCYLFYADTVPAYTHRACLLCTRQNRDVPLMLFRWWRLRISRVRCGKSTPMAAGMRTTARGSSMNRSRWRANARTFAHPLARQNDNRLFYLTPTTTHRGRYHPTRCGYRGGSLVLSAY